MILLFLRVWNAFLAVGVFAFGGRTVCEVEGKTRSIPDGNVINPAKKDLLVKLIDFKNIAYELLQMVLAQALAGMALFLSAFPVGVFVSVCHDDCLLPVIAATVFTADLCGEAGFPLFDCRMYPTISGGFFLASSVHASRLRFGSVTHRPHPHYPAKRMSPMRAGFFCSQKL